MKTTDFFRGLSFNRTVRAAEKLPAVGEGSDEDEERRAELVRSHLRGQSLVDAGVRFGPVTTVIALVGANLLGAFDGCSSEASGDGKSDPAAVVKPGEEIEKLHASPKIEDKRVSNKTEDKPTAK